MSQGHGRQAVQELPWLLETVTTAFQGLETESGTVQGKFFNKIVEDLRRRKQGTTLDQILDWVGPLSILALGGRHAFMKWRNTPR